MFYIKLKGIVSENQCGKRLDLILVDLFPNYTRSCVKKWILNGYVFVDNILINKPKMIIKKCVKILVNFKYISKRIDLPEYIFLDIVYEDNLIIVINKQSNLIVHPNHNSNGGTILNGLLYYFPDINVVPRCGIIHRLDKNTTGLMVVAKTLYSYLMLSNELKNRKFIKEYEAIVFGDLINDGTIIKPIKRHKIKRVCMMVSDDGKEAITHYSIISKYIYCTHVRILLETGRTHQIRVHMSYISHPLIGDILYGKKKYLSGKKHIIINNELRSFSRQALHATRLFFKHPIGNIYINCFSPLPSDMNRLLSFLSDYKITNDF
ncbi:RluA family pseudouridine synthase [Candidatus Purcelliella pentastirinorum]|uniref:RluA family pseudouridine synthase n=1 Tax=Candidatus Purcelliella pentastirinorum TaxID=472834 RepID=UPI002368EBB7|nr:RluA family pseudouridine synthase [Candidatus Purcelliella pentastirinorum]WDI78846.1 RluA family pseudouridine synthase [Candidatus Purcelliella pentastirinorum]WDR79979.1 RluA family pseudouridine synthase [Candidatus Purcelliella pentastirinorum]